MNGPPALLCERLLSKIVMPGPMTPCATWIGAYNRSAGLRRGHQGRYRATYRPVVWYLASTIYTAPLLLDVVAGIRRPTAEANEACHKGCPCGPSWDLVYRCVDLAHLRWGTRHENEADKYEEVLDHESRDDA